VAWLAVLGVSVPLRAQEADAAAVREQLRQLHQQNVELKQQLQRQQGLIEQLEKKVSELLGTSQKQRQTLESLQETLQRQPPEESEDRILRTSKPGSVVVSGQGGVGVFHQGSRGAFPNAEFRVDEAKLFVDAKVWKDTYAFGELDLTLREDKIEAFQLGKLYLDFESLIRPRCREGLVNLRVGRLDIPFGEEYLTRDVVDNPLISHSVSDLWGVDEGVELYGKWEKFQYAAAVQNGGYPLLRDFERDKALAARVSYDPTKWLHASVSGMRTGDIDVRGDRFSALWFGNSYLRALGPLSITDRFHASAVEGDLRLQWKSGHVKGALGYLRFGEDKLPRAEPTTSAFFNSYYGGSTFVVPTVTVAGDTRREVIYYYVECRQDLSDRFYAATRFSRMGADGGFPVVGHGPFDKRFAGELTDHLWRWSLGLGYRWSPDGVLKLEYTLDRGEFVGGMPRRGEDLIGLELGYRF
jgi:hypothetical protein